MPGHTFLYSPPVNMIRDLIALRRARRHLLHLDEPREPRPAPADVSVAWDLGPHDFSILRYWLDETPSHVSRDEPQLRRSRAFPTSPSSTSSIGSGRDRARRALVARARASCAGRRSSAPARWSSTTTRATEPVRVFDSGVMLRDPESVRRVPADLPHRRHRLARGAARPSRCCSRWPTSATRSGTGATPRSSAELGSTSCA